MNWICGTVLQDAHLSQVCFSLSCATSAIVFCIATPLKGWKQPSVTGQYILFISITVLTSIFSNTWILHSTSIIIVRICTATSCVETWETQPNECRYYAEFSLTTAACLCYTPPTPVSSNPDAIPGGWEGNGEKKRMGGWGGVCVHTYSLPQEFADMFHGNSAWEWNGGSDEYVRRHLGSFWFHLGPEDPRLKHVSRLFPDRTKPLSQTYWMVDPAVKWAPDSTRRLCSTFPGSVQDTTGQTREKQHTRIRGSINGRVHLNIHEHSLCHTHMWVRLWECAPRGVKCTLKWGKMITGETLPILACLNETLQAKKWPGNGQYSQYTNQLERLRGNMLSNRINASPLHYYNTGLVNLWIVLLLSVPACVWCLHMCQTSHHYSLDLLCSNSGTYS